MESHRSWLREGARIRGLIPGEIVEIIEATPAGAGVYLRYRDEVGLLESRLVPDAQLAGLTPVAPAAGFDSDLEDFQLAICGLRIRHAAQFNRLLAITSSNVEPLPHQVQAVYHHLLATRPLKFLLADDPGAGKTIMAGLYIREAMARGWLQRCLVVVPGNLDEQWQDELNEKFGLKFELFTRDCIANGDQAPLEGAPFLIARLDQFARSPELMDLISRSPYNLCIVDEAHKMTARNWGNRLIKSKRYQLGELLRDSTENLLLMTATPHNGKEGDYQHFLSLLRASAEPVADAQGQGLMRRLVKEQLVHLDGTRLFPDRRASSVTYRLGELERDLYEDVTTYVREEMNKVAGDDSKRTVGFSLLVLQRRLASSPQAIYRSLQRRRDRLRAEATRLEEMDQRLLAALKASTLTRTEGAADANDWPSEQEEDEASSLATAARSVDELLVEVQILDRLVTQAERVKASEVDAKWEALAGLLLSQQMYDDEGRRRKIIVFTEHRDTLEYLEERLSSILPEVAVEVIHGAVNRAERKNAQVRFTQESASSILLATDAAGEGVNLQTAHLMVNYDIPWNPNRLDQRFGRIHRIGQTQECHLWNLVAVDTREGAVFSTLLEKLEVQRKALGDQVFDVLGQVLTNESLTRLLSEAVAGSGQGIIEAALAGVSNDLESAVAQRAASVSTLTESELVDLRMEMSLSAVASLLPEVMREFLVDALGRYRGEIRQVRGGCWRIDHVPATIRESDAAVKTRYPLVSLAPTGGDVPVYESPDLLAPGHPLVMALAGVIGRDLDDCLANGVVLADDRDDADYGLLTYVPGDDPGAAPITMLVRPGCSPEPVNMALYNDLPVGPGLSVSSMSQPEEAALTALSVCASSQREKGDRVIAQAYVRGTASPVVAQAWRDSRDRARERLLELDVADKRLVAGQQGDGWHFAIHENGHCRFMLAVPDVHVSTLRPSEDRVRAHVGLDVVHAEPLSRGTSSSR